MSDVGSLRFVADTTHSGISCIVGVLGRHLHDPSQRHVDALKPIYGYLSTRENDGPVYDKNSPLDFTCCTDSDYATCKDTRKSVSENLVTSMAQLLIWRESLQKAPTHSSTEAKYISADTEARNLTCMSNLPNELLILKNRQPTIVIDDNPSTKYHNGIIVKNEANDLHILVDNNGTIVVDRQSTCFRHRK